MSPTPVLVAWLAPDTDPAQVAAAVHPATALPGDDGTQWVVVDPPEHVWESLHEATWCDALRSAWAVAVLLGDPDVEPTLNALRTAAPDTLTVADPDFGRVVYVLFDTPESALAALTC